MHACATQHRIATLGSSAIRTAILLLPLCLLLAGPWLEPPRAIAEEQQPQSPAFQPGLEVQIDSGLLRGTLEGDLRVFKGVPFAAPPVGALRLHDPQPPVPWPGVRDATAFGAACPQENLLVRQPKNEDCLFLNLWASEDPTPRPVMVWLHGGGFLVGAGSEPMYDGSRLARSGDVLVVTLNYRLGPLGFLAIDGLSEGTHDVGVGNYGIKDQVAALEWVRRNIAAFGGDPNNVTLFGESAGGISVCALLGAPSADGLYHRAIIQSGVGCHAFPEARKPTSWNRPALENGRELLRRVGCGEAPHPRRCLDEAPVEDFVDAVSVMDLFKAGPEDQILLAAPYVDGQFIPEQPMARLARGEADVPTIIGTNQDESTLFYLGTRIPTRRAFRRQVKALSRDRIPVEALLPIYPARVFPRARKAFLALLTDLSFSCPQLELAEAAFEGAPVFLYELQRRAWPTSLFGAHHGLDLPYVFGNFEVMHLRSNKKNRGLSREMQEAWTRFARFGAPEDWPAYHPGGVLKIWDTVPGTMSQADFRGGRCEALENIGLVL